MRHDIIAISNTLLDFLFNVDDKHLDELELKKGVFHLLAEDKVHDIIDRFDDPVIVPAGAATNTLMGMSALGAKTVLVGMVGDGPYGKMYEERVTNEGVVPKLAKNPKLRTGKVVSLVTNDAERTFAVHLGAAGEVSPDHLLEDDIKDSEYLYFTGYEYEAMTETILFAVDLAVKHGTKIVMDLADPELVKRHLQDLKALVGKLDILFMNELEAKSFTGEEPRKAARIVGESVSTVVVKTGPEGSIIFNNGIEYLIEAEKTDAIDTTGAGDLYAAGFLYSVIKGKSIEQAGRFGSYMGTKIVSQIGALMTKKAKKEVLEKFSFI